MAPITAALTGLEQWGASDDGRVCAGCRYLEGRIWFSTEGPRPPLHNGCRCVRRRLDADALHGAALMRIIVEAFRNGRQARALLDEAQDRRRQEVTRRETMAQGSDEAEDELERAEVRRRRRTVRRTSRRGPRQSGD